MTDPQQFRRRMKSGEQEEIDQRVLKLINSGVTSPIEIAKAFGYSNRKWGQRALNHLAEKGLLQKDATGRIVKSDQVKAQEESIDISRDAFSQIPSVAAWIQDMQTRNAGKPNKSWSKQRWALQTICETLNVPPDSLVCEMVNPDSSKLMKKSQTVEYWMRKFAVEHAKKSDSSIRRFTSALVDYGRSQHELALMHNITGILSRKKEGYGKYAHVKLTEEQIAQASIICEKRGDLLTRDLFEFGIDTGSRNKTLEMTKLADCEFFADFILVRQHESKTEGHGIADWEKYVATPQAMAHIKIRFNERRAQGQEYLFMDGTYNAFNKDVLLRLKQLYRDLGVTEEYFFNHPVHALRHSAAHHWLRVTNYDYDFVASILGWKGSAVLKEAYGAMPADVKMKKLREAAAKSQAMTVQVTA